MMSVYRWVARANCLTLLVHLIRLAASRTFWTAGNSRPTSTPIIAMTTKSSISVNPLASRRGDCETMTEASFRVTAQRRLGGLVGLRSLYIGVPIPKDYNRRLLDGEVRNDPRAPRGSGRTEAVCRTSIGRSR